MLKERFVLSILRNFMPVSHGKTSLDKSAPSGKLLSRNSRDVSKYLQGKRIAVISYYVLTY
jgi:hypothetical protein